jgi:hypothetical protein
MFEEDVELEVPRRFEMTVRNQPAKSIGTAAAAYLHDWALVSRLQLVFVGVEHSNFFRPQLKITVRRANVGVTQFDAR